MTESQQNKLLHTIDTALQKPEVFSNPEMSLELLSEIVKSNRQYVSHVINDVFHKNFPKLLNDDRVKEAQRRMTNIEKYGHLTNSAIAESVGFKSYPPFIAAFKEVTGLTPSMYLKITKEKSN